MAIRDLFPAWRPAWILHEDDDLIAIDKPPYVSTHAPEPDRHCHVAAVARGLRCKQLRSVRSADGQSSKALHARIIEVRDELSVMFGGLFEGGRPRRNQVRGFSLGLAERRVRLSRSDRTLAGTPTLMQVHESVQAPEAGLGLEEDGRRTAVGVVHVFSRCLTKGSTRSMPRERP